MNQRQSRYTHPEIFFCTLSLHSRRGLSKNVPWRWLSLAMKIHRRGKLIAETTVFIEFRIYNGLFKKRIRGLTIKKLMDIRGVYFFWLLRDTTTPPKKVKTYKKRPTTHPKKWNCHFFSISISQNKGKKR